MHAAEHGRVPKVERLPLSVICANSTDKIIERNQNRLLRPVFINGVEVGFAYSQSEKTVKKLSARGITITLWYFISRGHQAQALLPFCFKSYPDKSDCWDELMELYHMNLIEFTPGFGSDKYVEVNRIMAMRAREYGGCMVARSQMHIIVEQDPLLDRTVETKLLMPSFNGNDIIFPIDGPLGRRGCTFADTLTCVFEDPEWPRCILQQMNLRDQRIWMSNLADITQNSHWITIAAKVCRYQSLNSVYIPPGHPPFEAFPFQLHPSETNPPENRGFSKLRRRTRRIRFSDEYAFEKVNYIGRPNSVYRLNGSSHVAAGNDPKSAGTRQKLVLDNLSRLASVFGYNKAKSICDRNPTLVTAKDGLSKLAHLILEEEEKGRQKGNDEESDDAEEQKQKQEEGKKRESNEAKGEQKPEQEEKIELLESITSRFGGKKDSREGVKDSESGTGINLFLPLGSTISVATTISNSELPLEIAFKEKAVICSNSDGTTCQGTDLIYFSDSELEHGDKQPLHEVEIPM
uniref:RNase NYN domain-containing protein n=1 Tax=Setaria digitata TaxID=48799 RepID=A0A915PQH6_9BILA